MTERTTLDYLTPSGGTTHVKAVKLDLTPHSISNTRSSSYVYGCSLTVGSNRITSDSLHYKRYTATCSNIRTLRQAYGQKPLVKRLFYSPTSLQGNETTSKSWTVWRTTYGTHYHSLSFTTNGFATVFSEATRKTCLAAVKS